VWLAAIVVLLARALAGEPPLPHPTEAPVVVDPGDDRLPQRRAAHVEALVARARAEGLARSRPWTTLGHWRAGLLGAVSDADGPDFFLAPDGRTDPSAELEETLRGFFREPTSEELRGNALRVTEDGGLPPLQHPVCRFPARLRYLASVLPLDPGLLPVTSCPKLADHFGRAAGMGVSLVFSDYHAGNAGSVFGHTFLRMHRAPTSVGGEAAALLDDGINFGAVTNGEGPLLYAAKGLLGLYPGRFSRLAYFYKVREYGDFESRDLWEYPLDLAPDELWMLVAHVWELDNTWFAYFFRTENCSDQVLALLEAARPALRVRRGRWRSVLPVETVRDLGATLGAGGGPLVGEVHHRPSLRAQFEARVAGMDPALRRQVASLAERPDAAVPGAPDEVARVLDAAADLVDMRHARELVRPEETEGSRRKRAILARRAALGGASPAVVVPLPTHGRPDNGHRPARLSAGVRLDADSRARFEVGLRPMLHAPDDPAGGYPAGTAIELLSVRASVDPRADATHPVLRLEELGVLRMRTLEAVSRFGASPSRDVDVRVARVSDRGCQDCTAFVARGGPGAAVAFDGAWTAYGFALTEAQLVPARATPGAFGVRAGPGAAVGLRWVPSPRVVAEGDLAAAYLFGARPAPAWHARVIGGVQMGASSALQVEAALTPAGGRAGARVAWYR
jgi:hypothetical protein